MNVKRACWFRLSIKRTTPEPTNSRKLTYLNPPKPTLLGFLIATYFLIHVLKLPFARKSRCTKACTYIASTYICIYMYYVYYIYNMYIYMHVCVCVCVCACASSYTYSSCIQYMNRGSSLIAWGVPICTVRRVRGCGAEVPNLMPS